MANWRAYFDYRFVSAEELSGETIVKITECKSESIYNKRLKENENVLTLYFEGKKKGFVCNKTNAATIQKLVNSGDVNDWIGKKIILYPKEVFAYGETCKAVRVKLKQVIE